MRLAIVGSRGITDRMAIIMGVSEAMNKAMDLNLNPDVEEIVSGGADGVDTLAESYAKNYGIPTRIFPPEWKKHGKKAAFLRNSKIVEASDIVLAIWDGESKGTKMTIDIARRHAKPTIVLYPEDFS